MSLDHYERCIAWLDGAERFDRALAWLGMGHAFATLYRSATGPAGDQSSSLSNEQAWLEHFRETGKRRPDDSLAWRVPADDRDADLLDRVLAKPPHRIARLVRQFLLPRGDLGPAPRVRVAMASRNDERWLAPLGHPPAPRLAVSVRLEPVSQQPNLPQWPLRIGTLEHVPGEWYGRWALGRGPRFAVPVSLGRRHDSCDLLLYPGDAADLVRDLERSPLPLRACMVLLGKASHPEQLRDVTCMLGSNGYAIMQRDMLRRAFPAAANLAEELAHGRSFDAAWSDSFGEHAIAWLSDDLADLTLYTIESERLRRRSGLDVRPDEFFRRTVPRGPGWKSSPAPLPQREDAYDLARRLANLAESPRPATPEDQLEGAQRFLQQQSHNLPMAGTEQPADSGFFMGETARVRVRIAPPAEGWQAFLTPFPRLQAEPEETVQLQVCLVEPRQIGEPMWGELLLPPKGSSSVHSFDFVPRASGDFEARIIVLHRGRVVQTALLLAQVRAPGTPPLPSDAAAPRLAGMVRPRARIDDLRDRSKFDLAIVENHVPSGTARTVALSEKRAWVTGGNVAAGFSEKINTILSQIAHASEEYKSVAAPESAQLLRDLVMVGIELRKQLMLHSLERQETRIGNAEYIQLVTVHDGPTLPLEFIYDFKAPDPDAPICPSWAGGATEARCPAECGSNTRHVICPRGFWGISKVIERHQISGEHAQWGHEFFLQTEPDRVTDSIQLGNKFLLATSHLLNDEANNIKQRMHALGASHALHAQDWASWESLVKEQNPRLILCLAHVDDRTINHRLEINNHYLESAGIDREHVAPAPDGKPPLILLLGCDTANAGRDYSQHVINFRAVGAAIVVTTKCVVDANQAADAALILASELFENRGKITLGECMRDFRRKALADNLLLALGVVAYGDADWHITP